MNLSGRRRKWIAGASLAVVVLLCVGAYGARVGAGASPQEPPVTLEFPASQLARLEQRHLANDLSIPGTVQALSQATVRSRLSAVLQKVNVREGDPVRAGQVIAEFDTAPLREQLAERTAQLASARASLDQAQRTREANAQLVRQNFITQNAFDAADASFRSQSAAVAVAQAQLAQIQLQLDDAVVRAPIDGLVARRYVQSGEKVGFDTQLLSIIDLSLLEVRAQAAVADVARVTPGAAAEVQLEGLDGVILRGRVDRINPGADPGSRSIDLYVSFANPRNLVRAGMFATVRLHLAAGREVATLPLGAVQQEAGQPVVWSVREGHLARRVVSLGRRDESAQRVEIVGGVDPADQVVAGRFDNLKDGAAARVIAAAPAK